MSRYDSVFTESLKPYFNGIKNSKGLSREEEAELGKKIKDGDQNAIRELVKNNLQFVVRTAKKYTNSGIPLDDLISEGNFGLYKAAERFDYTKGKKFITYAVWWVKSCINDAIKNYKGNPDEVSFDEYGGLGDNENDEYQESAEIINNEYEQKIIEKQSRGMVIDELMKCLQEREKEILKLYFGLYGEKPMNLKEISQEMKISPERVRQVVNTSITKMKATALADEHFDEYSELR